MHSECIAKLSAIIQLFFPPQINPEGQNNTMKEKGCFDFRTLSYEEVCHVKVYM